MGLLGCRTVAELKEKAPELMLVNASSHRLQCAIDRSKAGYSLQPSMQSHWPQK